MTGYRWEEANLLSKFQLPSSYGLGVIGDMLHVTGDICHVTHTHPCPKGRNPSAATFPQLGFMESLRVREKSIL